MSRQAQLKSQVNLNLFSWERFPSKYNYRFNVFPIGVCLLSSRYYSFQGSSLQHNSIRLEKIMC